MTTGNGAETESGRAVAAAHGGYGPDPSPYARTAPHPPAYPPPAPPTEIERALSAAVAGGGDDAVVELLARTRLYVLVARLHADIPGWTAPCPRSATKSPGGPASRS